MPDKAFGEACLWLGRVVLALVVLNVVTSVSDGTTPAKRGAQIRAAVCRLLWRRRGDPVGPCLRLSWTRGPERV